MKLTVLGSGTCVPSLTRNAPGYLVQAKNAHILLDCGSGTLLQLEKIGKSYRDIDLLMLTHTHPDHCADLVPFIQALLVTPSELRKSVITLAGPPGFRDFLEQAVKLQMSWPEQLPLQIIEITDTFLFEGVSITASKIIHTHNSVSYRLEYEGKSLVFSGDCDYDEALISLAKETNLLVIECSLPDGMKKEGHLTSSECGDIATKSGTKRLLLTHFYPVTDDDDIRLHECKTVYQGEILMAKDLMTLDI